MTTLLIFVTMPYCQQYRQSQPTKNTRKQELYINHKVTDYGKAI